MVAKRSGPVKPPVLDLEANNPSNKQKKTKNEQASSAKQQKPNKDANKLNKLLQNKLLISTIFAVFAGAILGVAISFLLALIGVWPQKAPPANLLNSPASIAALEKQTATLEQSVSANSNSIDDINSHLEILQQTLDSAITQNQALENNLAKISEQITIINSQALTKQDLPEQIDLTPIEKRLTILSDKIATIDAGANSADASAIVNSISLLREQSELLKSEINNLQSNIVVNDQTINQLENTLQQLIDENSQLAEKITLLESKKPTTEPVAQLPISITALEGAIGLGKPFASELGAIKVAFPDIIIPDVLLNNATNGFALPKDIARDFSLLVPKLLAAKQIDENATWSQKLVQKSLSLLAIRPLGEAEGDSLEANIANIETALKNGDFIKADEYFNRLPKDIRALAGDSAKHMANLALAQNFINSLKIRKP